MYTIAIDAALNRIQFVLSGLLMADEVDAYTRELRHGMTKAGIGPGYAIVIDATDCTIQTQDVLQTMAEQMATMPKAGAIAVVTASTLARMQIRRLFQQPYARIVSSMAEGRAWVSHGIQPPASLPVPQASLREAIER